MVDIKRMKHLIALAGGAILAFGIIVLCFFFAAIMPFFRYPDARAASAERRPASAYGFRREKHPLSGVNFGLAFMGDREGDWGVVFRESDFDAARDAGFNFIRIQVQFLSRLSESEGKWIIDPVFLDRLDWAIGNILDRDMIAIIDAYRVIPDDKLSFRSRREREGVEEKFLAIWGALAERYRDYPPELRFELANEPHRPFGAKEWSALARRAIALIRAKGGNDASRTIIVGVPIRIAPVVHVWDQVNGIEGLDLPSAEEDSGIMVTFHYYNPYPFSHQGQTYTRDLATSSWMWMGNTWTDTEAQIAYVRRDFDAVERWAKEHRREVLLGEFGASVLADLESQVRWTSRVREEAEARGMAWTFWDFYRTDGLGSLYDQGTGAWRADILDALMPSGADDRAREASRVHVLVESLVDPEWRERRKAAEALGGCGPAAAEAVPALARALADEEWQVRIVAARSLGALAPDSRTAAQALIAALDDEEWQVRDAAARALAALGPVSRDAVPALTAALRDGEWQLRESAAIALGAIGPEARAALKEAPRPRGGRRMEAAEGGRGSRRGHRPGEPRSAGGLEAPAPRSRAAGARGLQKGP